MSGFTPGPWATHKVHKCYVVPLCHESRPVGGHVLDAKDIQDFAQVVASADQKARHRSLDERQANARLIAAAPELLALLEELIDIEGPQPGHIEWARKVQAAIAKARGEA